MGRCVYTGIYEPAIPRRTRTVSARRARAGPRDGRDDRPLPRRQLRLRLPLGGRDRPGARPLRRDLAWHSIETNEVGIDEFARWAEKAGVELMYAVNLGTRGVQEALDVQEYANHPGGTHLSELRVEERRASRTGSACGASATRWTVPGRPGTKPPTSTAGWRPKPPGPAALDPARTGRVRQLQPPCRPSGPGSRRCSSRPTTRSTPSPPRLLRADRRRPGQLPGLRRRHGPLHRQVVATADTSAPG